MANITWRNFAIGSAAIISSIIAMISVYKNKKAIIF